jgi:hypothetical protein
VLVRQAQEADLRPVNHREELRLPENDLNPEARPRMKADPVYTFSDQRRPWEYWQKKQEEALREALGRELFDYLESMTQNERNTVRD